MYEYVEKTLKGKKKWKNRKNWKNKKNVKYDVESTLKKKKKCIHSFGIYLLYLIIFF